MGRKLFLMRPGAARCPRLGERADVVSARAVAECARKRPAANIRRSEGVLATPRSIRCCAVAAGTARLSTALRCHDS